MQDPNADTEWNDILRAKGILPPKEEPTVDEETVVKVRLFHSPRFDFVVCSYWRTRCKSGLRVAAMLVNR